MKPSQAFGVVVRVMGVLGWLVGFFYLVSAFIALLAPKYRAGFRPWWRYGVAAVLFFLIEWVLLRRADRVVPCPHQEPSDRDSAVKRVGRDSRSTVPAG